MKPTSPLERALTADANAARVLPPARLRASILGQLDAEPSPLSSPLSSPLADETPARARSRSVRPMLAIAAGVLLAGLVWLALRTTPTSHVQIATSANAPSQPMNDVKVALSSLTQGAAIDGPLLAEAENLSRDTTRATRYLLDRVTTPFLPRSTPR